MTMWAEECLPLFQGILPFHFLKQTVSLFMYEFGAYPGRLEYIPGITLVHYRALCTVRTHCSHYGTFIYIQYCVFFLYKFWYKCLFNQFRIIELNNLKVPNIHLSQKNELLARCH